MCPAEGSGRRAAVSWTERPISAGVRTEVVDSSIGKRLRSPPEGKWTSPQPVPQPLMTRPLLRWSFEKDAAGWTAQHDCKVAAEKGTLRIQSTGGDPYLAQAVDVPGGGFLLELRMRSRTAGGGAVFWGTDKTPGHSEQRTAHFAMQHDGQWHDYAVPFAADGRLRSLRLDPGAAPGEIEVESIRLLRAEPHPLAIEQIDVLTDRVRAVVRNLRDAPVAVFGPPARRSSSTAGRVSKWSSRSRVLGRWSRSRSSCSRKVCRPCAAALFVFHENVKEEWIVRGSAVERRQCRRRRGAAVHESAT